MNKYMNKLSAGILASLVATGAFFKCSGLPVDTVTPIKQEKPIKELQDWNEEWTPLVYEALDKYGKDLLTFMPNDADEFCFTSDMKANYLKLIKSMAKYESTFNPNATYKETRMKPDQRGDTIISSGLLQVSVESCNGYVMEKRLTRKEELFDVARNLECSVKIFNKWVLRDKVLSNASDNLGIGRYYSVMRPGDKRKLIQWIMCKKE